jgi:HPt (histidine-containing phosphotransfer) domain-containing protein
VAPDEKTMAIRRLGISSDVYDDLYAEFVSIARHSAFLIETAKTAGDWHRIGKIAHSVKGMAANLGITMIFESARAVETNAARADDLPCVLTTTNEFLGKIGLL